MQNIVNATFVASSLGHITIDAQIEMFLCTEIDIGHIY